MSIKENVNNDIILLSCQCKTHKLEQRVVCGISKMAAALGAVDELIREYLLYRGFVQTLKAFEQEKKDDKDKGLRVSPH